VPAYYSYRSLVLKKRGFISFKPLMPLDIALPKAKEVRVVLVDQRISDLIEWWMESSDVGEVV
jgi:hypothetical protein